MPHVWHGGPAGVRHGQYPGGHRRASSGDALRERIKKAGSTGATAHIVLTPPRIPDTIETVPDINRSEEPPMSEREA